MFQNAQLFCCFFTRRGIFWFIIVIIELIINEVCDITVEEIKKLDKIVPKIQYPFGKGFWILRKIFEEDAEKYETTATEIARQYMGWKWNKH